MYEQLKESNVVELKEAKDKLPSTFWETYSSFANSNGGTIYLGIEEVKNGENKIVGVNNPSNIMKAIFDVANNTNKVSKNILSNDDVKLIEYKSKKIIEIHIRMASYLEKPIYLNANPYLSYVRDGEDDRLMNHNHVLSLLNRASVTSFDMEINKLGIGLEELNAPSLKRYREMFDIANPNNMFKNYDDETFFTLVGVLKKHDDKLIAMNAAVVLFGNLLQIRNIFPNFSLDYIVKNDFDSKWQQRIVSDDLTFSGNVFDFYRLVSNDLNMRLPSPYTLNNDVDVGHKLVYESARELFLNAIFNCDFSLPTGIKIIFDNNRLIIRNSGDMIISLEEAFQGGFSYPRNLGIATIFRNIKLGDKAGTGIPTVLENQKRLKYMSPIYEFNNVLLFVEVTLFFQNALDELEEQIIQLLKEHKNGLSLNSLKDLMSIGKYRLNNYLNNLLEKGLIKTNGKETKGKLFLLK